MVEGGREGREGRALGRRGGEADGLGGEGTAAEEGWGREEWSGRSAFLAAAVGYVLGQGQVWRLAWSVRRWGGGFLVLHLALLGLLGWPAVLLETGLGQFRSRGPGQLFRDMVPCLEGLGWALVYAATLLCLLSSAYQGLALHLAALSLGVPWGRCEAPRPLSPSLPDPDAHFRHNSPACFTLRDQAHCQHSPDQGVYAHARCFRPQHLQEALAEGKGSAPLMALTSLLQSCVADPSHYAQPRNRSTWHCAFRVRLSPPALEKPFGVEEVPASCSQDGVLASRELCSSSTTSLILDLDHRSSSPADLFTARARCLADLIHHSDRSSDCWSRANGQAPARVDRGGEALAEELFCMVREECDRSWPSEVLRDAECVRRVLEPGKSLAAEELLAELLDQGPPDELIPRAWSVGAPLALLAVWVLTGLLARGGLKKTGKLAMWTCGAALVGLVLLFLLVGSLSGFTKALSQALQPRWCSLGNPYLWADALSLVFHSLSTGQGGLMTLRSYSSFREDLVVDSVAVVVVDWLASLLTCLSVLGVVGEAAALTGRSVGVLVSGGPDLRPALGLLAQAAAEVEGGGRILSLLFFLSMFLLSLNGTLLGLETPLSFVEDEVGVERGWRRLATGLLCSVLCVLGLGTASRRGLALMESLERSVMGLSVPLLWALTAVGACWVYGAGRLVGDLALCAHSPLQAQPGLAFRPMESVFVGRGRLALYVLWGGVLPVTSLVWLFVAVYTYCQGAVGRGLWRVLLELAVGPGVVLVLCAAGAWRALVRRRLRKDALLSPRPKWGPAIPLNRAASRYAHNRDASSVMESSAMEGGGGEAGSDEEGLLAKRPSSRRTRGRGSRAKPSFPAADPSPVSQADDPAPHTQPLSPISSHLPDQPTHSTNTKTSTDQPSQIPSISHRLPPSTIHAHQNSDQP